MSRSFCNQRLCLTATSQPRGCCHQENAEGPISPSRNCEILPPTKHRLFYVMYSQFEDFWEHTHTYIHVHTYVSFNGLIWRQPGLASTRMSPFLILLELRMMEVVNGDNCSYKTCKSPVKSSPTNQQQVFLTGHMPFLSPNQQCQSTEGKVSITYQAHLGIFQPCTDKVKWIYRQSVSSPTTLTCYVSDPKSTMD